MWHHPKYYAALRAERRKLQAASAKPEEPRPERPKVPSSKHQAASTKRQGPARPAQPEVVLNKKFIDKDSDIGYHGIAPELSRVCRVAGRSSARVVPRPASDSCRSSSTKKTNSPLKVSAMSAVPVAGSFRAVSLNSSVPAQLGFNIKSKIDKRSKRQAASSKRQASSVKHQADIKIS